MTEQLGLVLTHAPTDSRLDTALRLMRAWRHCQRPLFGLFLQGDAVALARRDSASPSDATEALLDFCDSHAVPINACVGSCQSRGLCDPNGNPDEEAWDTRVTITGLGELSALLSDCARVISL